MGCFCAACGISKMTLHPGMPTALIPLVPVRGTDGKFNDQFGSPMIISNEGSKAFFRPLTLPIFGKYDHYGRIDNIIEDANTRAIEKYFDMSIDDFVEVICGRGETNDKFPDRICGMFVHADIYKHMAHNPIDEWGEPYNAYTNKYSLPDFVLEDLGFVKGEKDETKQRYNVPFRHPKIPCSIWSDGEWKHSFYRNKDESIHGLCGLVKFLEKYNFYIPPEIFNYKKIPVAELEYREALIGRNKYKKLYDELIGLADKEADDIKQRQLRRDAKDFLIDTNFFFRFADRYDTDNSTMDIYGNLIDVNNNEFRQLFVDYKTFELQMHMVNSLYFPTYCGLQDGCDEATIALNNKVNDILKKYESEQDDDD